MFLHPSTLNMIIKLAGKFEFVLHVSRNHVLCNITASDVSANQHKAQQLRVYGHSTYTEQQCTVSIAVKS